jgi:cell division protein FtsB
VAEERPGVAQRASRTQRPPPSGTGAARRRNREPRLTRAPRTRGVVAATTGLLGLSSTRRAALLAVVVCALAMTVSVPLRNYVAQRQELAAVSEQQQALRSEVDQLTQERSRLSDPAEVAAQARSRLGYVMPGQVPYVVQLPNDPAAGPAPDPDAGVPWYRSLWHEVAEGPR